jgi:DNA-binding MarR family transcriptional regulator
MSSWRLDTSSIGGFFPNKVSMTPMKPELFSLSERVGGDVLATRAMGRQVAGDLADVLATADAVILSFDGIEVATPPALEELFGVVHAALRGNEQGKLLVVSGMNADVQETVDFVLEHRHLTLAAVTDDQIELLGGNVLLKKTLKAAQELGRFTAPELAEELRIKLPNLHQRLNALVEMGALARERDESGGRGKRYAYHAPDTEEFQAISTS